MKIKYILRKKVTVGSVPHPFIPKKAGIKVDVKQYRHAKWYDYLFVFALRSLSKIVRRMI